MAANTVWALPNMLNAGTTAHAVDVVASVYIAVGLVIVRLLHEGPSIRALKRRLSAIKDGLDKAAHDVYDNAWIVVFSGGILVYAWWVVVFYNGGCSPWDVEPCLMGWPHHEATKQLRWFFHVMFGYYLYEMICTAIGRGTVLGKDMVVHHLMTMALMAIAYQYNLMRFGLTSMGLLDLSNPILHSAKICDKLALPQTEQPKWLLFTLFAATFFFARVLLMPWVVLRPCFTMGFNTLPFYGALFCTMLMCLIYAMQLFWFYKIYKLATRKSTNKSS